MDLPFVDSSIPFHLSPFHSTTTTTTTPFSFRWRRPGHHRESGLSGRGDVREWDGSGQRPFDCRPGSTTVLPTGVFCTAEFYQSARRSCRNPIQHDHGNLHARMFSSPSSLRSRNAPKSRLERDNNTGRGKDKTLILGPFQRVHKC